MKTCFYKVTLLVCVASMAFSTSLVAGPKGVIEVPKVANGSITIDGGFDDWNLAGRKNVLSQQPEFPDALENESTDAFGDFIAWDIDRAGPFNGTNYDDWDPESPSEHGSSVYLTYDDTNLYILAVFLDDELNGSNDESGFSNFLNDGFEIFIDGRNDSIDNPADENQFPNFDTEDNEADNPDIMANPDDFQMTFGLNDFFERENPGPSDLGAKQHYERGGDVDLSADKANYDAFLEDNVQGLNIAAREFADLRAAGALNPEIVADPNTVFEGYVIEALLPWGFQDGFEVVEGQDMGFDLFWRDVDDEPEPGFGGNIFWSDWAQNITVPSADDGTGLFNPDNWGALRFVDSPTLDLNGDGEVNVLDIDQVELGDTATRDAILAESKSDLGDVNADRSFDSGDLIDAFATGNYANGEAASYTQGDWNLNGVFDSDDLIEAFAEGSYDDGAPAATAAVPEPSTAVLMILAGLALVRRRR